METADGWEAALNVTVSLDTSVVHTSDPMPIAMGMHRKVTMNVFRSFVSDANASATSSQRAYAPAAGTSRRTSAAPRTSNDAIANAWAATGTPTTMTIAIRILDNNTAVGDRGRVAQNAS